MQRYNLLILIASLVDEEAKQTAEEIKELIKKVGGELTESQLMGKRKLSFAIKKVRHGFYLDFVFQISADKIKELDNELKLKSSILRWEILRFKKRKAAVVRKERKPVVTDYLYGQEKKEGHQEATAAAKVSLSDLNKKLDDILSAEGEAL